MTSGTGYKKKNIPFDKLKYSSLVPRRNQTSISPYPKHDEEVEPSRGEREKIKSNLGNVIGHIIAIVGIIITTALAVVIFLLNYVISTYNTPINDINSSFKSLNVRLNSLEQDSKDFKDDIKELRNKYDKLIDNLNNFKTLK